MELLEENKQSMKDQEYIDCYTFLEKKKKKNNKRKYDLDIMYIGVHRVTCCDIFEYNDADHFHDHDDHEVVLKLSTKIHKFSMKNISISVDNVIIDLNNDDYQRISYSNLDKILQSNGILENLKENVFQCTQMGLSHDKPIHSEELQVRFRLSV